MENLVDTKEDVSVRFRKLLKKGSSFEEDFNTLVLMWISFITEIITSHKLKSTSTTNDYKLADGWPTWNENSDVIPSIAKKFKSELNICLKPEAIPNVLRGLTWFVTLFDIYQKYKEPHVRLTKITKHPLGELFTYSDYQQSLGILSFLLNISEKDLLWIREKVEADGEKDLSMKRKDLLAVFKERFCNQSKNDNERDLYSNIRHYKLPFPEKETMYGWLVEKYAKIPTEQLEEFVNESRSQRLLEELKKRPPQELSFSTWVAINS